MLGTVWGEMQTPAPPFLGAQPLWEPTFHLLGFFFSGSNEKAQLQHLAQGMAHSREATLTVLCDADDIQRQTQPSLPHPHPPHQQLELSIKVLAK